MLDILQQIRAMLQTILDNQSAAKPSRAPLKRREFAKLINCSYTTVCRKIASKQIVEVSGRIPASQLEKFQSVQTKKKVKL